MIKKIWYILMPSERMEVKKIIFMIFMMALLDASGVASILPFIAVVSNPDLIQTNVVLHTIFNFSGRLGIQTTNQFLLLIGGLVMLLLLASLTFKALTLRAQTNFALMSEHNVGMRLVRGYLGQSYDWFLTRHSADLGKTILSEVSTVIGGGLVPLMALVAQSVVVIVLLVLLVLVDPILAISVGLGIGLAYSTVFAVVSSKMKRLGDACVQANRQRYSIVAEIFGGIKEVKFGGLEATYTQRLEKFSKSYCNDQALATIIGQMPRFILEAIAFGGMLLVILYLVAERGSFSAALPVVALYAFAGYRLMPAVQQIYAAFIQLRFVGPALNLLHNELVSLGEKNTHEVYNAVIRFADAIEVKGVSYRYPMSSDHALNGVDIKIPAHSSVGFVGATGSGKTTIVDLILGLLEPEQGHLVVDGLHITKANCRRWQASIGYVPQHIYLIDDSVMANIAFGVKGEDIDFEAVERAAKIADIHDFVVNSLPKGYATPIGERGIRLSGGQRQRIGLARALYQYPQILILDEATSALDNLTEQRVMKALDDLKQNITVILIAHRLSTVRLCDQIFLMERGKVKAQGTFDQLKESSKDFKKMLSSDFGQSSYE